MPHVRGARGATASQSIVSSISNNNAEENKKKEKEKEKENRVESGKVGSNLSRAPRESAAARASRAKVGDVRGYGGFRSCRGGSIPVPVQEERKREGEGERDKDSDRVRTLRTLSEAMSKGNRGVGTRGGYGYSGGSRGGR